MFSVGEDNFCFVFERFVFVFVLHSSTTELVSLFLIIVFKTFSEKQVVLLILKMQLFVGGVCSCC